MTTLHGLALNLTTQLDYDRLIAPCGMPEFGITSLARETQSTLTWRAGRDALLAALEQRFGVTFSDANEVAA
jgi:lipoyl(octanoyl) transferase